MSLRVDAEYFISQLAKQSNAYCEVDLGKYSVGERCGVGGFSFIYKLINESGEGDLAIKITSADFCKTTLPNEARNRIMRTLRRELEIARVLLQNPHENIVRFYAAEEILYEDESSCKQSQKTAFVYVMPFYQNTFARQTREASHFDEIIACRLGLHICNALKYLDVMGIVHRDIKPDNIYIQLTNTEPQYILGDFGACCYIDGYEAATEQHTGLNTPGFSPSEQFRDPLATPQPHWDTFALGATLFWYSNKMQVYHHDEESPEHGSPQLKKILAKALKNKPSERYLSADKMNDDLIDLQRLREREEKGDKQKYAIEIIPIREKEEKGEKQKYITEILPSSNKRTFFGYRKKQLAAFGGLCVLLAVLLLTPTIKGVLSDGLSFSQKGEVTDASFVAAELTADETEIDAGRLEQLSSSEEASGDEVVGESSPGTGSTQEAEEELAPPLVEPPTPTVEQTEPPAANQGDSPSANSQNSVTPDVSSTQIQQEAEIDILSVTNTGTEIIAGQETEMEVEVSYSCPSTGEYVLMVGVNSEEAYSYAMVAEAEYLASGSGTHTFSFSAIPQRFDDNVPFTVYANISDVDHGMSWTPLATAEFSLQVPLEQTVSATAAGASDDYGVEMLEGDFLVSVRDMDNPSRDGFCIYAITDSGELIMLCWEYSDPFYCQFPDARFDLYIDDGNGDPTFFECDYRDSPPIAIEFGV